MSQRVTKLVFLVAVVMVLLCFTPVSVEAVDPGYPANTYIQDVRVGSPANPLNYNDGGASILLTREGVRVGLFRDGARGLALFTIDSWRRQTGKQWPYNWRSVESVAREIQAHCWLLGNTNTIRPITISFKG